MTDWGSRQQAQAAAFDTILGASLRVTGWPRETLREVVTAAGFAVEDEDIRSYHLPAPDAPPETQVFLLARRS